MAINWTAVQSDVEDEIDAKLEERCQAMTEKIYEGITEFSTYLTDYYDVSDGDAQTATAGLFTNLAAKITADGWPSASEVGEEVPTATRTTILTSLEDELEANIVSHVNTGVGDKYPNVAES